MAFTCDRCGKSRKGGEERERERESMCVCARVRVCVCEPSTPRSPSERVLGRLRWLGTSPSNLTRPPPSTSTTSCGLTVSRAGGRTIRDVNPLALAKGTIFAQCSHCEKYHQLVDNLELIEEYNLKDEE